MINVKRINGITNAVFLVFVSTVVLLTVKGLLSFGHGLGDIFVLIAIIVGTVVFELVYFYILRTRNTLYIISLVALSILLILLKLTFFRGPEYGWNGHLFLGPV